MKILYAVQATGNGHISRAIELLPHLKKYGDIDIFLSGSNSQLGVGLPVVYRSKGMSLVYNSKGGLDYLAILKNLNPMAHIKDAFDLPVKKYDLVLNDFESITSLACKIKRCKSIHFGHQASFVSKKVPRPFERDMMGELILKYYCSAEKNFGLHFKQYDKNIYTPVIKEQIRNAEPQNFGHVTVYLPQFSCKELSTYLKSLTYIKFQVFTKETNKREVQDNIEYFPINYELFSQSMITCHGIITGGGFETPAEAMYLGKKIMLFPIRGQYEQWCNAAALNEWKIPVLESLNTYTGVKIHRWYYKDEFNYDIDYQPTEAAVKWLFNSIDSKNFVEGNIKHDLHSGEFIPAIK
jgi:uncharacterized protein (TIGR00661 family)